MSDLPSIKPQPGEEGEPALHIYAAGFSSSDEVRAVAERLIDQHPRLHFLRQWGLAYLLHFTDPPTDNDRHSWAKARLVPKWARALTEDYDAAITVNEPIWRAIGEQHREPLVLHELLHFGEHEKTGALITVPHDVEEFGFVVRTYGQWRPSLVQFAEQLALGLGRGNG